MLRVCLDCGLVAYTVEDLDKFVCVKDHKYGKRNLCKSCANIRLLKWKNKKRDHVNKYAREWRKNNPHYKDNKDRLKKQFTFLDGTITPEANLRKNVCHECGKTYPDELKEQTCMHHMFYDEINPTAWIVELCRPCHTSLHNLLRWRGLPLPTPL